MTARALRNLPLLILLAIVGLRPLVSESYRTTGTAVSAALDEAGDPWASATLILDLVILATAAGVTMRRFLSSTRPYRPTGLEWGVLLIAIAAALSSLAAGDRRPAINASLDLVSAAALCLALAQLLDRPWRIRLALCVIVASGVANATECAYQHFISFAETEQVYMENREQLWAAQGLALDSPNVRMFEQRMRSREASGYFAHSNVAGGYLLLAAFAGIALTLMGEQAAHGRYRILSRVAAAVLAVGLFGTVILTKGLGALLAGAAALVLLLGLRHFAPTVARRRRAFLLSGWAVVLLAVVVFVAIGWNRGGFSNPSLDFRWQYWTVSAEMLSDHGVTGVGAENFGDHYIQYKPITSPEEVKNPHNVLVQFATEYGLLGLVGAIGLLIGGSWKATQPLAPPAAIAERGKRVDAPPANMTLWTIALLPAIFIPQALLLPSYNPYFVVWATGFAALSWLAAFVLISLLVPGPSDGAAPAAGWLTAVNCGLFAFLLQDCINFALFVPGAQTTFFALVAVTIAPRIKPVPTTRRAPVAGMVAALCVVATLVAVVNLPGPLHAERALRAARAARPQPAASIVTHPAMLLFKAAEAYDALDATAAEERARWLLSLAHTANAGPHASRFADLGLEAINTAIERAPLRHSLWRCKAQLYMVRGQATGDTRDYAAAIEAVDHAIELYPLNPQTYLQRADCRMALGSCEAIRSALADYQQALTLDDARPAWETMRRFNERMKNDIHDRVTQALERLRRDCAGL